MDSESSRYLLVIGAFLVLGFIPGAAFIAAGIRNWKQQETISFRNIIQKNVFPPMEPVILTGQQARSMAIARIVVGIFFIFLSAHMTVIPLLFE